MKLKEILFLISLLIVLGSCNKTRVCECTETDLSSGETEITTSSVGGNLFKSNSQQALETQCSQGNAANSAAKKTCILKD